MNNKTPEGHRNFSSEKIKMKNSKKYDILLADAQANLSSSSLKIEETEWLTSEEAALFLKIPVGSLRNMTSNGKVPYYKLGRSNRYRLEDLNKLLLSHRKGAKLWELK